MTIWHLQRHNRNKKAKSLENSKKIHKFAGETLLLIQINKTMKKIFTLISMALVAMSANAQDKYAAVDAEGNMAAEFTVVVDAEGNATNVADGKSIVTITTENLVLEAVGGTTPANISGGAQDITPGTSMGSYTDSRAMFMSTPTMWVLLVLGPTSPGSRTRRVTPLTSREQECTTFLALVTPM